MSFYLTKRNQTYYYRIKIPSDLSSVFPCREIKQSLKTRDVSAAKVLASNLNCKIQNVFALLRSECLPAGQISDLVMSALPRKRTISMQLVCSAGNDEKLLSEVIELYVIESSPKWAKKSKFEFEKQLEVLLQVLGDRAITSYTRSDCLKCRDVLEVLPRSYTKKIIYRGKSITEIVAMGSTDTIHAKTVNKYLVLLSSVFKWAIRHTGLTENPAEGLALPISTKVSEERKTYSLVDLKRIVECLPFGNTIETYWIPLIGAYSGMRLEEICQLKVLDVKSVDGVLCFDINGEAEDKSVKTVASERIVPVHPELFRLGFHDYVKSRCHRVQLWGNLEQDQYGDWGKRFSKQYGKFNRKHITKDSKKVFHSFRHLVGDTLKQANVPESVIAELLGHSHGKDNMTMSRYGKKYRPAVLLEALIKLEYGL